MLQEHVIWHVMCCCSHSNKNSIGGNKMKKVLSTLVAALVAVSFSGMVFAAEPAAAPAAPADATAAAPAAEKAPVKKAKKKVKKAKKAVKKKEAPAAAPAAPAEAPPAQ
jgi:cobalamin biosynthesis Mg chelatase CobN